MSPCVIQKENTFLQPSKVTRNYHDYTSPSTLLVSTTCLNEVPGAGRTGRACHRGARALRGSRRPSRSARGRAGARTRVLSVNLADVRRRDAPVSSLGGELDQILVLLDLPAARSLRAQHLPGVEPGGVHDVPEADGLQLGRGHRAASPPVRKYHDRPLSLAELARTPDELLQRDVPRHPGMVARKLAFVIDVDERGAARQPGARLEHAHRVVMKHAREKAARDRSGSESHPCARHHRRAPPQ